MAVGVLATTRRDRCQDCVVRFIAGVRDSVAEVSIATQAANPLQHASVVRALR